MYLLFASIFIHTLCVSFSERLTGRNINTENDNRPEYCLAEVFSAKCLNNEIILMNTAVYGRMRVGRCLQTEESSELHGIVGSDPRFLGCSVNVLDILDEKCSGRNQCEFQIPDAELKKEKPCLQGLTLYLQANYSCVTVIEEDRSCIVSVSSNPLHMMTSSINTLRCGTKTQPWTLEAPVGQQIEVSLIEFHSRRRHSVDTQLVNNCVSRGQIIDKSARNNVPICRVSHQREIIVYKSSSNVIQVVLNETKDSENHHGSFLIRFTAVGCLNLVPPEDTWLRRNEGEAVIGCYSSRQTWTLHCTDNIWVGVIGNCTRDNFQPKNVHHVGAVREDYQVIVIVIIVFLGLAVCLMICCCGAVMYRRYAKKIIKYRQYNQEPENTKHLQQAFQPEGDNIQRTLVPTGVA